MMQSPPFANLKQAACQACYGMEQAIIMMFRSFRVGGVKKVEGMTH
jgi:hypothetical protein